MCGLGNRGMKEAGRCYLEGRKSAKWVTFTGKQSRRPEAATQIINLVAGVSAGIALSHSGDDWG